VRARSLASTCAAFRISQNPDLHRIRSVEVVGATLGEGAGVLAREFPDVVAGPSVADARVRLQVSLADWTVDRFDPTTLDCATRAMPEPFALELVADGVNDVEHATVEVLTRCQSLLARRNAASSTPLFERVLAAHRALHDIDKPLVAADYYHALDTWQWLLRIDPTAGSAVQIAALFHDIERLHSESDERVEQHAADYQAFKDAHARGGAEILVHTLAELEAPLSVIQRAHELVARHERPGEDRELALLNDADALSFFSLNTPGFLEYFGASHTRRKVVYTLRRLRPELRWRIGWIRMRRDVRAIVDDVIAGEGRS
jgi:hypothetical protein